MITCCKKSNMQTLGIYILPQDQFKISHKCIYFRRYDCANIVYFPCFVFQNDKPRYRGNRRGKIGFSFHFLAFRGKANPLRKFHENLSLGVSNDYWWLQRLVFEDFNFEGESKFMELIHVLFLRIGSTEYHGRKNIQLDARLIRLVGTCYSCLLYFSGSMNTANTASTDRWTLNY